MKSLKLNKVVSSLLITSSLCGVMLASTSHLQAHADINDSINNALGKSTGFDNAAFKRRIDAGEKNININNATGVDASLIAYAKAHGANVNINNSKFINAVGADTASNLNVNNSTGVNTSSAGTGTTSDELSNEINNLNNSTYDTSVQLNRNINKSDLSQQIIALLQSLAQDNSTSSQTNGTSTQSNDTDTDVPTNYLTSNGVNGLTSGSSTLTTDQAQRVVSMALQLANSKIPYVWGGESLSGMDCSGLTDYVYRNALGVSLGHYTVTQESHVIAKPVSQAQPGDLLFWGNKGATHHVAIYVGNNQYVAAPQPGQNVDLETINSAFMPSFAGSVKG